MYKNMKGTGYYPYGMAIPYGGDIQPYKYGGQPSARRSGRCNVGYQAGGNIQCPPSGNEMERMHGIGLYDSRARWYDPALGRTTTMDSEAGTYPGISPYLWCAANPVRYTDPSGRIIEIDPALTEEQKKFLSDNLDLLKKSEVFATFISELENNKDFVVRVTFGNTVTDKKANGVEESVYGQYDPNNSTITFLEGISVPEVTIAEEFYHSYQDMISKQTNTEVSWNREFEAKTVVAIGALDCCILFPNGFTGNPGYFYNLYLNSKDSLNDIGRFRKEYISNGKIYSDYWKKQCKPGYSEPVNGFPSTLKNILKSYYK